MEFWKKTLFAMFEKLIFSSEFNHYRLNVLIVIKEVKFKDLNQGKYPILLK